MPSQYNNPKPNSRVRKAGEAQQNEFSLVDDFSLGYRNREDKTKLPPGILIDGSQNVLTSVDNMVGVTKGYVLDGQSANQSFLLWEPEVSGAGFLLLNTGGKIILTI